ncbi:MAG: GNAT family N-acetyltransferase, partial [Xanthobacteraceae bacterium]
MKKPSRPPAAKLRRGRMSDLDALLAIEEAVFATDVLSRRSLRRFLATTGATLIVAEAAGKLAGYALVLYPPRSMFARLYSIAVAPHIGRRGVGPLLLAAAE